MHLRLSPRSVSRLSLFLPPQLPHHPILLCITGPMQRWRLWRSRTPSPPLSAVWSEWLAAWFPLTTITQRAVRMCSHCSWALCQEWTPTTSASVWWVMDVLISSEEEFLDKQTIQLLVIKFYRALVCPINISWKWNEHLSLTNLQLMWPNLQFLLGL